MSKGTLAPNEPHPAAAEALAWISQMPTASKAVWMESFASCAIEGNRLSEVCGETLSRLLRGEPVGDRYLLGLAWCLRAMKDEGDERKASTAAAERA